MKALEPNYFSCITQSATQPLVPRYFVCIALLLGDESLCTLKSIRGLANTVHLFTEFSGCLSLEQEFKSTSWICHLN